MKALQRKRLEKTTTLINEAREAYDRRNLEGCWKLVPRIIKALEAYYPGTVWRQAPGLNGDYACGECHETTPDEDGHTLSKCFAELSQENGFLCDEVGRLLAEIIRLETDLGQAQASAKSARDELMLARQYCLQQYGRPLDLLDELEEGPCGFLIERHNELLEPDLDDVAPANALLEFAASLDPEAPIAPGCEVTAKQLCEIVGVAIFWFGYWDSPPTHIHKEIQDDRRQLSNKNHELRAEIERLERENAALKGSLVSTTSSISVATSTEKNDE